MEFGVERQSMEWSKRVRFGVMNGAWLAVWEGNGRESGRDAVKVYVEVRIDTCTHLHHRLLSLQRGVKKSA